MSGSRHRAIWLGCVLLLLLPLLLAAAIAYSETGFYNPAEALRILWNEYGQTARAEILKLRLLRALCAAGAGGALALAGGMTQGLFRNPLAEPGVLGVSSGAALGAAIAVALLGGYGAQYVSQFAAIATQSGGAADASTGPAFFGLMLIPIMALAGAFTMSILVYRLATWRGRIDVPTLLLTGVAMNALAAALIAAVQALLLQDWQVSRAIMAWGFGSLEDRTATHLAVIAVGATLALLSIPFTGLHLDLLAGGEEDAAALGADPTSVKRWTLLFVSVATACTVAVCGQIGFVGLLVPHFVRIFAGARHRTLLPLAFLAGATLLLSVVVFQHGLCPAISQALARAHWETLSHVFARMMSLPPGVLTSMLGAPLFFVLLVRQERRGLW